MVLGSNSGNWHNSSRILNSDTPRGRLGFLLTPERSLYTSAEAELSTLGDLGDWFRGGLSKVGGYPAGSWRSDFTDPHKNLTLRTWLGSSSALDQPSFLRG